MKTAIYIIPCLFIGVGFVIPYLIRHISNKHKGISHIGFFDFSPDGFKSSHILIPVCIGNLLIISILIIDFILNSNRQGDLRTYINYTNHLSIAYIVFFVISLAFFIIQFCIFKKHNITLMFRAYKKSLITSVVFLITAALYQALKIFFYVL